MKAETKFDIEYQPTEDEPFMNPRQLDYFRRKLLAWKASILAESRPPAWVYLRGIMSAQSSTAIRKARASSN